MSSTSLHYFSTSKSWRQIWSRVNQPFKYTFFITSEVNSSMTCCFYHIYSGQNFFYFFPYLNLRCSTWFAAMLQNKLHVFGCSFYWSFSLVLYSFFGVQTSVFIQNYVDFGRLSRYHHSFCPGMEIFCYWALSTSVTRETSVLSAPNARVIKGGSGALLPRKQKLKLDSRKRK